MPRAYLDHASTSPLRPAARDAMLAVLEPGAGPAGDPGRIHEEGMRSRALIEHARAQVGLRFGARSREVVFTSGATESIAYVCAGVASRGSHQVLTAVEHSAVRLGAEAHGDVSIVTVDRDGFADPAALAAAVTRDTSVVHVQLGNHETGVVQPLDEIIGAIRATSSDVLIHVDAAQAAGRVPIDFSTLGADLVSLSGHKLGGPLGVGALLVRRGVRLRSLLLGGDQERARRAGLENLLGIVGLGAACASVDVEAEAAAQRTLIERLRPAVFGVEAVVEYGSPEHRLPHLLCVGIGDVEPQAVLLGLDRAGVAVHSGSACASESLEPSPVLEAMGVDAHHSLRFSVGWSSTDADVDLAAERFPTVVAKLRSLRP